MEMYESLKGGVDDNLPDILVDLVERFELTYFIEDEPVITITASTLEMLEEKLDRVDTARNTYASELINAQYEVDDLT